MNLSVTTLRICKGKAMILDKQMQDNGTAPRGLDSILLTDSERVSDGLEDMLTAAIGEHGHVLRHVDVALALLVIEVAKRAEDRADWFPRGKWATVQAMQERTERELRWLFCTAQRELCGTP
jgi:hypothetical protein